MTLSILALLLTGCDSGAATDSGGTSSQDSGAVDTLSRGDDSGVMDSDVLEPVVVLAGERPTNLLVISVDTFRRDYLGAISGLDTTPNLDAMIADGVLLRDHAPCSNWTYNSLLCAQTGRNTVDLGIHVEMGAQITATTSQADTVDYLLKLQGFDAALSSANPYFQPAFGLGRGFDLVAFKGKWQATETFESALVHHGELAVDGNPWYLHVHLADPHAPYTAPVEYERDTADLAPSPFELTTDDGFRALHRGWGGASQVDQALTLEWIYRLYEAEVRYFDDELGRFLGELAERGALDDTLVVLWSDHGEQFFEDGSIGHGVDLHDEEADGFAVFWMADQGLVPAIHREPTTQIDLAPTVFDVLGLPQSDQFDGEIAGMAPADRGRLVAHWNPHEPAMAWQVGDHKLIYRWGGGVSLFDRATDRDELTDIAAQRPELTSLLWQGLAPQVDKMLAINPFPDAVDPGLEP